MGCSQLLHPWPGTPSKPLGSPQPSRDMPIERVLSAWLQCAGSEPRDKSAAGATLPHEAVKGFFRILLQIQLDRRFLSSCWGVGGQEATMCYKALLPNLGGQLRHPLHTGLC